MPSEKIELLQWLYVAIVAPILGGLGGWARDWWSKRSAAKRRKNRTLAALSGLPPEAKAVLIEFHNYGTHTRRTDPFDPPVRLLVKSGYMSKGAGGGTYDAVDSYCTIHPDIWEVMDDWLIDDAVSVMEVRKKFFESSQHG